MTEENQERNARAELEKAQRCLREARVLLDAELPEGATTRAYFAVFHGARALLVSRGLQPRSHRGVASLFGEHFTGEGALEPRFGRMLAHLQRDREDADYVVAPLIDAGLAGGAIDDATEFLAQAERFLGG